MIALVTAKAALLKPFGRTSEWPRPLMGRCSGVNHSLPKVAGGMRLLGRQLQRRRRSVPHRRRTLTYWKG